MKQEPINFPKLARLAADLGVGKPRIIGETKNGPQCIRQAGTFYFWNRYPDGSVGEEGVWRNMAVTVGLNDMLNVYFTNSTQSPNWYAFIIDNTGYTSGINAGDTMSSHGGWQENTNFSESTRPQWSPGTASAGVLVNGTAMTFTITSNSQAKGAGICSDNTKGGNSGTLWATAVESLPRSLTSGVPFQMIYQNSLSSVS